MVTARETADSKVIAMEDRAGRTAPPPRTLLEEVNAHLVCALCRGYYIDATTIVECLHSFCRSCIIKHLQVKSYCPVCEMMINSAKPNIKPDKALQDIVYKLVPGLFQKEMRRRQAFYSSRPGPAACATPEQRGEDTERIIFSPEDVISFSLEYIDRIEVECASSRSSESGNESAPCNEAGAPTRRYLQCPAVVNISHLKKFLSMKYDIDATHFFLDILYKRVPLPDYYTLMDIAYIYNWKRNEPMRFFYQITDFSVIRDRFGFFGINRPSGHAHLRKGSPSGGDATAPDSPALITEGSSDCSDGSRSPLPQSGNSLTAKVKSDSIDNKETECSETGSSLSPPEGSNAESLTSAQSSCAVDVEKSQFLNSFELTAKSSLGKCSGSPVKEEPASPATSAATEPRSSEVFELKSPIKAIKPDAATSPGKRKSLPALDDLSDVKKPKLLADKIVKDTSTKIAGKVNPPDTLVKSVADALAENCSQQSSKPHFSLGSSSAGRIPQGELTKTKTAINSLTNTIVRTNRNDEKTVKSSSTASPTSSLLKANLDNVAKKCLPTPNKLSMKRKAPDGQTSQSLPTNQPKFAMPKTEQIGELSQPVCKPPVLVPKNTKAAPEGTDISHIKLNTPPPKVLKCENTRKLPETPKEIPKRPEQTSPRLPRPPLKLNIPKPLKSQGDPLKTLFDSCNINIPSSLSITLTDQKLDQGPAEPSSMENSDSQKTSQSGPKSVANQSNAPSPPVVHNYIEILKLPDLESSKSSDSDKSVKSVVNKSGEAGVGGKGPVPKLKPIGDTKQAKSGSITKPTTFQQTFLQSLQQQCEKPKYLKTRIEYPKINAAPSSVPPISPSASGIALPMPTVIPGVVSLPAVSSVPTAPAAAVVEPTQEKSLTPTPLAKSKLVPISQPVRKFCTILPKTVKSDSALDLSTPHASQSQLGPQQTKALETMQSIANLAKKQSFTQRMASPSQVFSQESFKMNTSSVTALRIPIPPPKHLKPTPNTNSLQALSAGSPKHAPDYFMPSKSSVNIRSNNGAAALNPKSNPSTAYAQASQRSLTRSPSSSPKLVIACSSPKSQSPERKQLLSPRTVDNGSQSNLISSSQISSTNHAAADATSGPKEIPKVVKLTKVPVNSKNVNSRGASSAHRPGTSGYGTQTSEMTAYSEQMSPQQVYILQQLELQTRLGFLPPGAAAQWYNNPAARAHFERIMKNNPQ